MRSFFRDVLIFALATSFAALVAVGVMAAPAAEAEQGAAAAVSAR